MKRVLIAGAGLAGLAAAHELSHAGAAVTMVEMRDRIGGRVWTVRDGFIDGYHGELGGEFIDEAHARMRALAERFGLQLVHVVPAGFTEVLRRPGQDRVVGRTGPWEALNDVFAPLVRRYKAAGGDPSADAVREIATCSVRDWLQRVDASPEVHAMAEALRGFFLADPDELSALPLIEQLALGAPARVTMYRVLGGNDRLIEAMARDTSARILLQHRLVQIDQAADRVLAQVIDANGHVQQIEADAAIITLPASTLRDVTIRPALPEQQWRAISSLRYGRATKAAIQLGGSGLRDRRAQAFATNSGIGAFWDASAGQPSANTSMVNILAGGSASRELEARMRAGASAVFADLCWLDLPGVPVVASSAATWEHDPAARGGYAFIDPAFDAAWRPLLARRAGRLLFAGEHTSEKYQGYMEGAAESGLRAAAELLGGP